MNGSYEVRKVKKYLVKKALRELARSMEEFTQYDVYDWLERIIGRPLTPSEKKSVTLILRNEAELKEVRQDTRTRIKIYIFML